MAANLLNSRIVMRVGTRRISQTAVLVLIATSIIALVIEKTGHETLLTFAILQGLTLAPFGWPGPISRRWRWSGWATSPAPRRACRASSASPAARCSAPWSDLRRGTTVPLHAAFLIGGIVSIAIVAVVERGQLFRPLAQ